MYHAEKDILTALNVLRKQVDHSSSKVHSGSGICLNVELILRGYNFDKVTGYSVIDILTPIFRIWPEYSGNKHYPVPSPETAPIGSSYCKVEMAEYEYQFCQNHWTGSYGASRIRLLDFCILTLEAAEWNKS